jgi:hypothetical protein
MPPKDLPPFATVQGYSRHWRDHGLFEKINFALLLQAREAAERTEPIGRGHRQSIGQNH